MEPAIGTQLVGGFVKFAGDTVAQLKREEVDLELLRLKRDILAERLHDLESEVHKAVRLQKRNAVGDLAARGFLNSSLKESTLLAIDRDANQQLDVARREYNRAIEEISLMERRILAGPWNRLKRWIRGY